MSLEVPFPSGSGRPMTARPLPFTLGPTSEPKSNKLTPKISESQSQSLSISAPAPHLVPFPPPRTTLVHKTLHSSIRARLPVPPQASQPPLNTLSSHRPGRKTLRQPLNIDLQSSYGASIHTRDQDCIRAFFQNVKGLTYTNTGEDYAYYLSCTSSLGADIIGMAETNSAWTHHHLRNSFHKHARGQYHQHKTDFSSPSQTTDPIPDKEPFQAGGTLTMITNSLVSMACGDSAQDTLGLGRWSSLTLRGQDSRSFTIFTAYRVCKGNIQSATIGSSFSREYEHHRSLGIKNPQPR
jgi:hypothetical protein